MDVNQSGFMVNDDGKAMIQLTSANAEPLVIASSNSGPLRAFKRSSNEKSKVVKLNADDSYAMIVFKDGKKQRFEFSYGGGYLSQSSRVLNLPKAVSTLTIYNFHGKGRNINVN
jgi:hypothetical protein